MHQGLALSPLLFAIVSMIKVREFFVCRGCTDQLASVDKTSVDIGDGASLELVDTFCYLGDVLNIPVDGDADTAVEARVCNKWN